MFLTYEDAVQHALDYIGGTNAQESAIRDAKRSVLAAYGDLATEHTWSYLSATGRLNLNPAYTDSTATFVKSGGILPNLWTFSPGPLPDWAASGFIRVGNVIYYVDKRLDDTTLTTMEPFSPTADLADAQSVTLYQDTYPMPDDFSASDQFLYEESFGGMSYTSAEDWLRQGRYTNQVGDPRWYTFTGGEEKFPGKIVVRLFPYPGSAKTIDFIYRRTFRVMANYRVAVGTASCVSGSSLVAVSGNSSMTSSLVGAVLRLSANVSVPPTSPVGENPAAYAGMISGFTAPATLSVSDPVQFTAGSVKYTISDPVDIDNKTMLTAFLRGVEKQLSIGRVFKDKPSARIQYEEALRKAKASDSRSLTGRVCGQAVRYRQRLARMPISFD